MHGIPNGIVNYDLRDRDVFLENNTLEALTLIANLKKEIKSVVGTQVLSLALSYEENKDKQIEIKSNVDRELVYNIEHAVHHMALIRIGLKAIESDIDLPEDFGIASSTVRHRYSQQTN